MDSFSKLLNEALEQATPVSFDEFMRFATALITSTSVDKIPVAIERAMALSPGELASIVKQVQFTGDTQALRDAISRNPEYAAQFVELGRKILPEQDLLASVKKMEYQASESYGSEDLNPPMVNRRGEQMLKTSSHYSTEKATCPICKIGKLDFHKEETKLGQPGHMWPGTRGHVVCEHCEASFSHCENCDKWYQQDDFDFDRGYCDDCVNNSLGGIYNAEADYHNQGQDLGGH